MENLLTRKLEKFAPLSADDRRLLDDVVKPLRNVAARTDIIREGHASKDVHLVLEGFACRYKLLKNGKRQIVAYLVPGDFCDLNVFILKAMDHSIGTLSPCRVVDIPRHRILELMERPGIARAIWYATLVDEATLRDMLYLKGTLDYMIFYHLFEAVSPGWWERTNRRLTKEQGRAMTGYTPGAGVPYGVPWLYMQNHQGQSFGLLGANR